MRLTIALGVSRGDVISIVGAGGKTSAMFRLAGELSSDGWRVVTTTTTMIRRRERSEQTILEPERRALIGKAQAALETHNHVTLVSAFREADGKLIGVEPSVVDELIGLPQVDVVIVEADGAKGRSLKAPASYEPVIPSSTTILVPVAGVDAVGRRLDETIVHRPEIVSRVAATQLGQVITPQALSAVLVHPHGGLKNAPHDARVMPLLNKVRAGQMDSPYEIAQLLLAEPRVLRVLLGAVSEADPVKEVWGRVGAVILAAGESRRFGSPKQLLPWGKTTLLERAVDTALNSAVQETIVVMGYRAEQIVELIRSRPVTLVVNEEWQNGLSTSVRSGLRALPANCDACLFLLADQPNVTPGLLDKIVSKYRHTLAPIVAPAYRDRRGNPVLFGRALFAELLAMEGDQGGRGVIQRHQDELEIVEVDEENIFLDIDTVADYEGAK